MDMLRKPFPANYGAMRPEAAADALADELGYQQMVDEYTTKLIEDLTERALQGDRSLVDLDAIQEDESCADLFWDRHADLVKAWNTGVRGYDLEILVAGLMGITRGIVTALVIDKLPDVLGNLETDAMERAYERNH